MKSFKDYLLESPMSVNAAKQLGLDYYGFGRWGRGNKVTHETLHGRLIQVKKSYDPHNTGETKLTHLNHIDDLPILKGHAGVQEAINVLLAAKHADDAILPTAKIDGSPSLVIIHNNGKLAVATKSAFNKEPKINYTPEDAEKNHGHAPGLVEKLKQALQHLPKIQPHGIHQGDVLFGENDKKIMDINGIPHITFRPNTIRYAAPLNSEIGQQINRAKFGIAIHSRYNENGVLSPAHDSKFSSHPDVFQLPVAHNSNKLDNATFDNDMSTLGRIYQSINPDAIPLVSNPTQAPLFLQYINNRVKEGLDIGKATDFTQWYKVKKLKTISALKTEKGRSKAITQLNKELQFYNEYDTAINDAFNLCQAISNAKQHLIQHFNSSVSLKHFIDSPDGLVSTNPEGFVITSHQGPVKFVSRQEFSKNNFLMSKNR